MSNTLILDITTLLTHFRLDLEMPERAIVLAHWQAQGPERNTRSKIGGRTRTSCSGLRAEVKGTSLLENENNIPPINPKKCKKIN